VWRRREEFTFVAPAAQFDAVLADAIASTARPYFISDSGDNPTAGGAGDVTWTLRELLASPVLAASGKRAIYASIPDAGAVADAVRVGVGGRLDVEAGARVDARHAGPVRLVGVVSSITERSTERESTNTEVVVATEHVDVILTRVRRPFHTEADFTGLGLDPRAADIVVVKIGYLEPELFEMSADWQMALTPGGVDQDLLRLGHVRIARPMFPYDREFAYDPAAAALLMPGDTRP
jgi:microcystin degradation protein MlrC